MTNWTKPAILQPENEQSAVAHLKTYFEGSKFSGNFFERLDGGGDAEAVANEMTPGDLLSLSMLSVEVNGAAARELLQGPKAAAASELLAQIPRDLSLTDARGREALVEDGPAWKLWFVLREVDTFGPVRTSKLLARKRPHLIPIYDCVVREQFGAKNSLRQWSDMSELFADADVVSHLERLREGAAVGEDISLLRVLDVVVWMEGRGTDKVEPQRVDAEI